MTSSSTICPGCGVAVTVGYTRCPRCHAPMPSARMKRESMQAGGTSVAPEDGGGGRGVWIVGALVVLAIAIVAVVALSGGKHRAAAADGVEADAGTEGAALAVPVDEPLAPPVIPVRLDPLGAADRLERSLATERLFAKSTLRGGDLELRSEFCARPRLRAIIAAAAADLRSQGVASIRCLELHGAEAFSQAL